VIHARRTRFSLSWPLFVLVFAVSIHFSFAQTITIRAHAPAGTPDSASLYVAGSLPALGSWRPDGLRMTKEEDGVWTAVVHAPTGKYVEFKITLGNWDQEALYAVGKIPGNIRVRVNADTTVDLSPVQWKQPTRSSPAGGITGAVRYHRGLTGKGLNSPRDIIVWLPPSYDSATTRRFPVLYMQDGQNVFDPTTSFGGVDWQADEVADSLIRHGAMQEVIIVAIGNSPDRMLEYADTTLGRTYAEFVVHQLKPKIDSVYRTKSDRANTAVMGSSLGGLISFLFVWWHPDIFSRAACVSTSFLYQHDKVIHEVESAKRFPREIAIYLDCGTAEKQLLPGYERMHKLLKKKGLVEGETLMGFLDEGARHNERSWARRLWRPLEFLFPYDTQ
jgi:predicted alpha/beta superfamily hydrolase